MAKTKLDTAQKTESELTEMLKDLKKQVREISISVMQNREKNVKKPRALRKQIARLKTTLRQKEILAEVN